MLRNVFLFHELNLSPQCGPVCHFINTVTSVFNSAEGRDSLACEAHPLSPTLQKCQAAQNVKDVSDSFFLSPVYPAYFSEDQGVY